MSRFGIKAMKGLPRGLKLYLITLFYTGFAIGYLAGAGASYFSAGLLFIGMLLLMFGGKYARS